MSQLQNDFHQCDIIYKNNNNNNKHIYVQCLDIPKEYKSMPSDQHCHMRNINMK